MPDEAPHYEVICHAAVGGDADVCWVAIGRWQYADGTIEWFLEGWEDRGEADFDAKVPDEKSAVKRAQEEFGIRPEDWRPGPQPWGRPG